MYPVSLKASLTEKNPPPLQNINKRLKQQGNTKLVDRNEHPVENDTNIVPDKNEEPYPWIDKEDPRRNMTDQEILENYVDLSDSDLNAAEKKSLYKVLLKNARKHFLLEMR